MQLSLAKRKILHARGRKPLTIPINQTPPAAYSSRVIRPPQAYDVFINHRGMDTKRTIATLLYERLVCLKIRPFLDTKNMKPGDKLFEKINGAITSCKVGVAVFSPGYCESYFCLHELALLTEARKRVIPIFCDVKPSELVVRDREYGVFPRDQIERYRLALEEAKFTVGLAFDSSKGNWAEVLSKAADTVKESLDEYEEEEGGGLICSDI